MSERKQIRRKIRRRKGNSGRIVGIVSKYFKISIRDKPMWFWVLGYPILFMIIYFVGFNTAGAQTFDLAFVSYDSEPFGPQVVGEEIDFGSEFLMNLFRDPQYNLTDSFTSRFDLTEEEAKILVESGEIDAVIIIPSNFSDFLYELEGTPNVTIFSTPDPTSKAIISSVVENIINQLIVNQEQIDLTKINVISARENIETFDFMMPGIVIAGVTIAIMNIAQNMGHEKEFGLMERLDTTPVPREVQLLGNGFAQLCFSALSSIILIGCLYLFGVEIHPNANVFLAFLNCFILSFTCIGIGLIIAAVVKDSNAAGGLAWVIILPLQMFGGAIANMGDGPFNQIFPTYYATNSMRNIMVYGLGFDHVIEDFIVNIVFGIIFFSLGLIIFSKKKKV